jgi:hypothetical protein
MVWDHDTHWALKERTTAPASLSLYREAMLAMRQSSKVEKILKTHPRGNRVELKEGVNDTVKDKKKG